MEAEVRVTNQRPVAKPRDHLRPISEIEIKILKCWDYCWGMVPMTSHELMTKNFLGGFLDVFITEIQLKKFENSKNTTPPIVV